MRSRSSQRSILIAGAGLCGLTAALALLRLGRPVTVVEQAATLSEVGAGLTVSRGAMRCLHWLGLTPQVVACSELSVALPFLHYRTGRLLREPMPTPTGAAAAFASRQLHRADLHALLVSAVRAAGGDIRLGHRLVEAAPDGDGIAAHFASGVRIHASILVGCDGLRSVVRGLVRNERNAPKFAGQVAYRCLVSADTARPWLGAGRGAVYIGPGCTLNRYTLRQGSVVNCVGLANTSDWREEGWSTPASNAEFLQHFADWHPDVTGLISAAPADSIIKWALFEHPPQPGWSSGRMVLAGDAAHPMLPFLGLGAAMAIEDAVILAQALTDYEDTGQGLSRYEAARFPRTREVFEQSRRQGVLTQSQDPDSYSTAASPAHDPAIFDFNPLLNARSADDAASSRASS